MIRTGGGADYKGEAEETIVVMEQFYILIVVHTQIYSVDK